MNHQVNPWLAAAIIGIALGIFGVKFWTHDAALRVGGPDQMQIDPTGNLHLHLSGTLFTFSPSGDLIAELDLAELGVYDLKGDFALFSNGDLLIRRGRYEPSVIESIRRVLRLKDNKPPVATSTEEGLARCTATTMTCRPFGDAAFDVDSAFHLAIDWNTDDVYLTDTPRHTLRKFDATGKELASTNDGYLFPNQVSYRDGRLIVANTNRHALVEASAGTEDFGHVIASHRSNGASSHGRTWPFSFARVGDTWWVNNMSDGMSHGRISVLDDGLSLKRAIDLPEDADPIDIAVLNDRVLITDLDNNRIYYFNTVGTRLDVTPPPRVDDLLARNAERKQRYGHIDDMATRAFFLLLVGGFALAIVQARRSHAPETTLDPAATLITCEHAGIQWIPRVKRAQALQWMLVIPLLGLAGLSLSMVFAQQPDMDTTPVFGAIALFVLVAVVALRRQDRVAIGVLGDMLVIRDAQNRCAAGRGGNILYSDFTIMINGVHIRIRPQPPLFETQQIVQKVMPLLRDATYVEPGAMMNLIIGGQGKWATWISLVALAATGLAIALGKLP